MRPLGDIVEQINNSASSCDFGSLQAYRTRIKGLQRTSARIFRQPLNPNWVFHHGGRSELQFNVGYEDLEDGRRQFRHGVAFSLEPSRSFPDVSSLIAKIPPFNDYLREHLAEVADFEMWHWDAFAGRRSENYAPRIISPELACQGSFIFLGRSYEPTRINIGQIIYDFDRLLPLYLFVESGNEPSSGLAAYKAQEQILFVAREPPASLWTTATQTAKQIDVRLRHTAIQRMLYDRLVTNFGKDCVGAENLCATGGRIDLTVKTLSEFHIYEIKTASSARGCIREAIGQLLDYSMWPVSSCVTHLYVVGDPPLTDDTKAYLDRLNSDLSVPLRYIQISP